MDSEMMTDNLRTLNVRTPCTILSGRAGLGALLVLGLLACGTNETRQDLDASSDTTLSDVGEDGTTTPDAMVRPDTTVREDTTVRPDIDEPDGEELDGEELDIHTPDTIGPRDTSPVEVMTDASGCFIEEPEVHRAEAVACDRERPTDGPFLDPGAEAFSDCTTHEDCADGGENGRCTGNSHDGWYCTYDSCFDDSGCGGGLCACSGGWRSDANVCLGGDCTTDSDCGAGSYCAPTYGDCGAYGGVEAYYCRTCEDECVNDSDCNDDPSGWGPGYCMFSQEVGHWMCGYQQCAG
jgi:hypothetical protein